MVIRKVPNQLASGNVTYNARICGVERTDGTWEGWIEFRPVDANRPILSTHQETSQPNRAALEYWADGLEPIYMDGAIARAQGRLL